MGRSGYSEEDDDYDQWASIMWRGAVTSAMRGQKGQAFLRETLAALDALPRPELIANDLTAEGAFCTLGSVGRSRGTDMSRVDVDDCYSVAALFQIPRALASEIMWENDEAGRTFETPRARWERVRSWVVKHLRDDQPVLSSHPHRQQSERRSRERRQSSNG